MLDAGLTAFCCTIQSALGDWRRCNGCVLPLHALLAQPVVVCMGALLVNGTPTRQMALKTQDGILRWIKQST